MSDPASSTSLVKTVGAEDTAKALGSGDVMVPGRRGSSRGSRKRPSPPSTCQPDTMPVLNIYTETHQIIPPSMTKALRGRIGCPDYSEFVAKGGHIGVMVAGRSARSALQMAVSNWLSER